STWLTREARAAQQQGMAALRFQHTGTGAIVDIERSLTPWLRDRSAIGRTPLPDVPETYLICIRSPDEGVRLVPVGKAAGALYCMLAEPRSVAGVARA